MANTTVKGKFNVVAENGDVQTIYPKTTGDQVLVDRSSNASVIPNDVANLQHIVNKMGSLALKSKVETSDFTTGTMINSIADLKSNTETGKIADATVVKDIESRVDTLENSNLVTVDELDAGLATKPDTEINDSVTSTSLTWSSKKLSDQLTTLNSNTSVLTSRVDTIIALPDGSTTNDARLEDICVGYDDHEYTSPGESVRTQISDVYNELRDIQSIFMIRYDDMNIIQNYYINNSGSIAHHDNDFLNITDYIKIPYLTKKLIINMVFLSDIYENDTSSLVFYDINKRMIRIVPYKNISDNNTIIKNHINKIILDVPENSSYIRLTVGNNTFNDINKTYIIFNNVNDIPDNSYDFELIKNLCFTKLTDLNFTINKYIDTDGKIKTFNYAGDYTYAATEDYIYIYQKYSHIYIHKMYIPSSGTASISFYNIKKNLLSAKQLIYMKYKQIIDIPDDAYYVRFSITNSVENIENNLYGEIYLCNKIKNDIIEEYTCERIANKYICGNNINNHNDNVYSISSLFVGDASSILLNVAIVDLAGYSFYDYDSNYISTINNSSRLSKYNILKMSEIGIPNNAAIIKFSSLLNEPVYIKKTKCYKNINKYNVNYSIFHNGFINNSNEIIESDDYMYSDKISLVRGEYFILNEYTKANTNNPCYAIIYDIDNNINKIISYKDIFGPLIYKAKINDYYIQICIDSDYDTKFEIFFTSFTNNSDIETPFYNEPDIHDSIGLIQCFDKVGCIGDSLASGEVGYLDSNGERHFRDVYQHSWGQYLARMTGNTYYNWSSGGRTTKSWLASPYATQCYDGNHLCSAYIIGLAANDIDSNKLPGGVGEESDIDLEDYTNNNSDTFYGCYGTIIQKILEIQPLAKIFIFTLPISNEQANIFNNAIRNIASKWSNVYLVDLASPENIQFYRSALIQKCVKFGHYNAIGYRQMALFIANQINKVMKDNIDDFMDIDWIPVS